MKNKIWLVVMTALTLAMFAVTPAAAQGPGPRTGGGIVFGGNVTVESGTTYEGGLIFGGSVRVRSGGIVAGDMVLFGGNLQVEQGGKVDGNLVLLGGNVDMAGEANGDVVLTGGNIHLRPTAVVKGDIRLAGGNLTRDEGATVQGTISQENGPRIGFLPRLPVPSLFTRPSGYGFDYLGGVIQALALAALGALVMVFFPQQVHRVADTAQQSFAPSLGVGCLTLLILPVLLVVLAITIVGIPLTIIGAIVAAAAFYFGWITVGYLAGERILEALKVREVAPVLAVIIGVLIIALLGEVPCLGAIVSFLIGLLGLGAVILTRFGTRAYPYMPMLAAPAPTSAPPRATLPEVPFTSPAPDQPSDTPPTAGPRTSE